jgi:prepilin-type N-terminal cleavage/methylation domain-containing protein/prepilin-type processing-associated H-X9-DG protein
MCGTRRIGRLEIMISGRQSGFLAGQIRRNISKRAGFTLIELLVVIAIIALLMAILVPVLRSARNQARAVVCQTNLKQWGQILNLYIQDNEGFLPGSVLYAIPFILRGPFKNSDNQIVSSYCPISTEGIRCCPMATAESGESSKKSGWELSLASGERWEGEVRYGGTFRAWEIEGLGPPFRGSYGFNRYLFHHDVWIPFRGFGGSRGFNTYEVTGNANIPAFLDATLYASAPESYDSPPRLEDHDGSWRIQSFCVNRHNGYINGLFLDWSVRKIGLKELWTLKWYPGFDTANDWTKAGGVQPEDWPKWMRKFKDY